jgi:hypothetical protein
MSISEDEAKVKNIQQPGYQERKANAELHKRQRQVVAVTKLSKDEVFPAWATNLGNLYYIVTVSMLMHLNSCLGNAHLDLQRKLKNIYG